MRKKAACGLTLLEVTIALGIIILMSTGILLSVRGVERRNLHNASLALQADLRYAQRRAISEGQAFRVVFELVNNRYTIQTNVFPPEVVRRVSLPEGITLESVGNGNDVIFHPRGTPSRAFTILLRSESYQQALTIIPSGGRVRIDEIEPA